MATAGTLAILILGGMSLTARPVSAATSSGVTLTNTQATSGSAFLPSFQVTLPSFNAGTGDSLLLVGVSAHGSAVTSVTFGGLALSPAAISFHNNDAEFWYMLRPSGTGDIVVTMQGLSSVVVGADAFAGVDLATPFPTVATGYAGSAGSPTVTLTAKYPNSTVVDLPSIYGGVTLGSPTCNQQWDINMPNAISGASSSKAASAPGPVTCSWTASGSGDLWDDVALEIKAAGSTTTTTTTTSTAAPGTIVVSAHRIYATYWAPCFATSCTNPTAPCNTACTGPGATMYIDLYNASGSLVATGFADENGLTFSGLTPGATYYVYPQDCDFCHGSLHNVVFQQWGDGTTARPEAAVPGSVLAAWYSCTNGCSGVGA